MQNKTNHNTEPTNVQKVQIIPLIFLSLAAPALFTHNIIRARHRVRPFKWNQILADSAMTWALKLSRTGKMKLSNLSVNYGENIYVYNGIEEPAATAHATGISLLRKNIYTKIFCTSILLSTDIRSGLRWSVLQK